MSGPANLSSQRVAIVDSIAPQSTAATVTSGWIDATVFHNFLALVQLGALGALATVDAKLQQATKTDGTGTKDVAGKAIVQFTKANNDDNKQAAINLKQEDLDFNNGFKFFRVSITVGTAASQVGAAVLGLDARYGFASDNKNATEAQII
ncbi:hypothetical protein [Bradyrhizobium elkanii]|uniref:hypothetical protein n=1 Tax=Bradyrhizobium elkanii TaxID=29448 RepID=UPI000841D830|nr:hypothetical protein [Bradyrhizobium elkanii]ODM77788.1 hypothetical protein A6452_34500 [Bradyrhizobium elkanii]ODM81756.1 hypothetical protein A6X20_19015 [Bradyrhizobium elkanii]